jgi:Spy/CpxP family protein refolding chaperone
MVMRKWKWWIIGLEGVLLIVVMTVFPGFADQGHSMMHGGHDQEEQDDHSAHYLKHLLKHAKEIGLTQEQIGKLKTMQLDFKRTEARLEADGKIAKLELHALLEDEKADLAAIKTKVNQVKYAEGALMFAAIKAKRDGMALLTPDQREKDRAVHEQMMSGGQHGAGGGGMGHGGMMGGMGGMMGGMGGMGGGGGHGGRGGMMGGGGHEGQSGGDHGGQGGGDHGGGDTSGGQQHQH